MAKETNLEEAVRERVVPLLEETLEKHWGVRLPALEGNIADKLSHSSPIYVPVGLPFREAKRSFKQSFLEHELRVHRGNVSALSRILGIDRRSVHRVIKDLGIDVEALRSADVVGDDLGGEQFAYETIRGEIDAYRELIRPEKMRELYEELPRLSRNIARVLPHKEMSWKEAEREFELTFFRHALEHHAGSLTDLAKRIELRSETLHRKLKKLGLK